VLEQAPRVQYVQAALEVLSVGLVHLKELEEEREAHLL
jgi:hypothetical protein